MGKIYDEYFVPVFRYILFISNNPHIAEEITQETFFRALKKVDRFRGDSTLRVWLCQIAKNLYIDSLKKSKRTVSLRVDYQEDAPDPEAILLQEEYVQRLHRLLHDLKEPYKEVFSLRTFGELSFGEIASLFEKSESWARVTYHRARLMIKKGIENEDNL